MTEHRGGGTGAQHVDVIDVRRTGDHRVDQRQHLASRTGTTDPAGQAHRGVDQCFQPEALRQRGDQHKTGVGDQVRVVEGGVDAVDSVRY